MIRQIKIFRIFKMEKAQTMVEFALVFPLVLLITYGLIEFGRMIFIYTSVTSAAREGARYGTAAGGSTPQYADCAGIQDAVRRTAFLITIPNSAITISYDSGPGTATKSNCPPPLDGSNPSHIILGDRVVVSVNVPYSPVIKFLGLGSFPMHSYNARSIMVNILVK
jgi:hypothetical protein